MKFHNGNDVLTSVNVVTSAIALSVFLLDISEADRLPSAVHIGCYKDRRTRALKGYSKNSQENSIEWCTRTCLKRNKGYNLMGVESENECYCGKQSDRYYKHGKCTKRRCRCDQKCTGNKQQICGGDWAISIYSIKWVDKTTTAKTTPTTTPTTTTTTTTPISTSTSTISATTITTATKIPTTTTTFTSTTLKAYVTFATSNASTRMIPTFTIKTSTTTTNHITDHITYDEVNTSVTSGQTDHSAANVKISVLEPGASDESDAGGKHGSRKGESTGAFIGGGVSGVVVIILIVCISVFSVKRRKLKAHKSCTPKSNPVYCQDKPVANVVTSDVQRFSDKASEQHYYNTVTNMDIYSNGSIAHNKAAATTRAAHQTAAVTLVENDVYDTTAAWNGQVYIGGGVVSSWSGQNSDCLYDNVYCNSAPAAETQATAISCDYANTGITLADNDLYTVS